MLKNSSKIKVAIVGAGTIGLYLAWKLSQAGHKVIVFEKNSKILAKPCSGLISERLKKINIADALSILQEEDDDVTLYYLDRISDIKFYLHDETFNHHDPKNILQIIDDYYKIITDS